MAATTYGRVPHQESHSDDHEDVETANLIESTFKAQSDPKTVAVTGRKDEGEGGLFFRPRFSVNALCILILGIVSIALTQLVTLSASSSRPPPQTTSPETAMAPRPPPETALQVQPPAQTAMAPQAGIATHPLRLSPLLRQTKVSCQDKGPLLRSFPKPAVLEIGAHLGEEWDDLFKGAEHLWSVEPSPDKQEKLRQEVGKQKALGHAVDLFQMGISTETGVLKFWVDGKNSQQNTLGRPPPWVSQEIFDAQAVKIKTSTLDDFWKNELGRAHITMLKVDTQGHEPAVLLGGAELFREDPPDIVHMEYSPGLMKSAHLDGVALLNFVYSFGYICFDCDDFSPPALTDNLRTFKEYTEAFGRFDYKGVNHGAWADMVCLK